MNIGFGWDPNNASALIITYGHSYIGFPDDIFVPAQNMFVEFESSSSYQAEGFQLDIVVRNISGKIKFEYTNYVTMI